MKVMAAISQAGQAAKTRLPTLGITLGVSVMQIAFVVPATSTYLVRGATLPDTVLTTMAGIEKPFFIFIANRNANEYHSQ